MVRAINSYKIHFNKNIRDDINYRTFETCGCRTFLLTNYTQNLEKLFNIGSELITYNSLFELDEIVKYYLNNDSKRDEIAEAGYNRVKSEHTYYHRAKKLIDIINEN